MRLETCGNCFSGLFSPLMINILYAHTDTHSCMYTKEVAKCSNFQKKIEKTFQRNFLAGQEI